MKDKIAESSLFCKANVIKDVSVEFYINDFLESLSSSVLNNFVIKGCIALKYSMSSVNNLEFRGTRDLDLHVFNKNDWEFFVENCCSLASNNSPNKVEYKLLNRRGFGKNPNGDRLTIQADSTKFTVDMNFGPDVDFYINKENGLKFYSIPSILCDKLCVLSSNKICRRIKDLIDVYFIATNFDLNYYDTCILVMDRMNKTGRNFSCEIFIYDEGNFDMLKHAFDKYSESIKVDKSFEEVLGIVQGFTFPFYKFSSNNMFDYKYWKSGVLRWE